jgi:hypothetical protein
MTYMALIYGPPMPSSMTLPPEAIQAWMDYSQAARDAGVYVDANQLSDPTTATTVTVRDGRRIVSDGPFAETKEVLGGYYLFNCANLDEALDWAAKCPAASSGGKVEVRPIVEH